MLQMDLQWDWFSSLDDFLHEWRYLLANLSVFIVPLSLGWFRLHWVLWSYIFVSLLVCFIFLRCLVLVRRQSRPSDSLSYSSISYHVAIQIICESDFFSRYQAFHSALSLSFSPSSFDVRHFGGPLYSLTPASPILMNSLLRNGRSPLSCIILQSISVPVR